MVLPTNIKLGLKCSPCTNTLAYFDEENSLETLKPGGKGILKQLTNGMYYKSFTIVNDNRK